VNGYHDEVKKRGVKTTNPFTTQWWGDRTFVVSDPYGYEIWFYNSKITGSLQRVENPVLKPLSPDLVNGFF